MPQQINLLSAFHPGMQGIKRWRKLCSIVLKVLNFEDLKCLSVMDSLEFCVSSGLRWVWELELCSLLCSVFSRKCNLNWIFWIYSAWFRESIWTARLLLFVLGWRLPSSALLAPKQPCSTRFILLMESKQNQHAVSRTSKVTKFFSPFHRKRQEEGWHRHAVQGDS